MSDERRHVGPVEPGALRLSDLRAGDWVRFEANGKLVTGEVRYFGRDDIDVMTYAGDGQPEDLLWKHVGLGCVREITYLADSEADQSGHK